MLDFGYDVDLGEDYVDLLEFIGRNLIRGWFKDRFPSKRELEEKLRKVRRYHMRKLEIVVSFLVSKYLEYRNVAIAARRERT